MTARSFIPALLVLASICGCTTLEVPTFADDDGAIRGYDPVAYHLVGIPTKGSSAFSSVHNGATWYFSSEENRRLFKATPEKYAPQYGGYCAYAMSKGRVVSTDPHAWHIYDGKLYLNYSLRVRKTWLKDVPGHVRLADEHWDEKTKSGGFK